MGASERHLWNPTTPCVFLSCEGEEGLPALSFAVRMGGARAHM